MKERRMISPYTQRSTDSQKINLFCIPFAGGSSYAFRDLGRYVADFVNIVAIDLPGHGRKMRSPLLTNIHEMTDCIFREIKDELNKPYAVYGHSMGALLGYLLSRKVAEENMSEPLCLFVSGHYSPTVPPKQKTLHLLPQEAFIRKVTEYGGIPAEVIREKDLMDLFVPILRADFQSVAEYVYQPTAPLDIPITVMIGSNDTTKYDEALRWQEVTSRKISLRQFPGGHFFIFEYLSEMCKIICRNIEACVTVRPN